GVGAEGVPGALSRDCLRDGRVCPGRGGLIKSAYEEFGRTSAAENLIRQSDASLLARDRKRNLFLQPRLHTKHAATRSVGPPAYSDLTVRRCNRHRFIEWHQLTIDHPAARG